MFPIAKIVKSNSHVDYVARVIDRLDAERPPAETDYGFAQFVTAPLGAGEEEAVGVVYTTMLANPEYGSYGPRLSTHAELAVLSPDYLNEQGVLLGILLVGSRERGAGGGVWTTRHGVPRRVVPVGQEVYPLADAEVYGFHAEPGGALRLHYFSQVLAHAGPFAAPLVEAVLSQLEPACTAQERQRLCVLRKSLVWQRTVGGARL